MGTQAGFPTTHWASVLAARDGRERTRHLDHLFRDYWSPVYCYIRRTWNKSEDEARDLTQDFFVRMIETDFLKDVSPDRGRFRTYVKACLRHFLLDDHKYGRALKRGGGVKHFSLDGVDAPVEPAAESSPDEAFDSEWIHALLRAALPELEAALTQAGREACWKLFRALDLDAPADRRPSYAELARTFSLPEQAVKSQVDYARKTLRKIILGKIRQYSLTDEDARQELMELFPT